MSVLMKTLMTAPEPEELTIQQVLAKAAPAKSAPVAVPQPRKHSGPVYRSIHLKRLILQSGKPFNPEGEFFYPETQEQIEQLEYFATVGRAVKI